MTGSIAVRVEGTVGLDEPAKLLEELTAETGLPWRQEQAALPPGSLDGGVSSMVLEAVIGGFVGSALQIATQRVVDRWRGERLDPPTVIVVVQQPPGPDAVTARHGEGPAVPGADPATTLPGGTHAAAAGRERTEQAGRAPAGQDSSGAADDPGAPPASSPEGS